MFDPGITKLDHFGWINYCKCMVMFRGLLPKNTRLQMCPQKACSETKPPQMVLKMDLDIGVSPGFGGFDSGPNLQPCKINGWNLQTTHVQKENDGNQTSMRTCSSRSSSRGVQPYVCVGGFKYFTCSPLFGEDVQFD